ncbi:MAG: S-methyl-5-thioribose-1-phosphate isomerase [Candidatus Micrarchaeota archaeon]|nr:S-methyl-5-thioribose-1-phosphate isomerase [Candidatus Micrarchaeota archaeon]
MKVKVEGKVLNYKNIWFEGGKLHFIDQTKLPFKFSIFTSNNYRQTAAAIKEMKVRGAPAIGVAAAYALAQAALEFEGENLDGFVAHIKKASSAMKGTRPTAVDLFNAVDEILKVLEKGRNVEDCRELILNKAEALAEGSLQACRRIGANGEKLVKDGSSILTHCNAGALACVDYGTALAPLRLAHSRGKKIFVFVDETRPRLQGALTEWELQNEGIPHAVIVDNAAGFYMQRKEIDLCIVGADRIAVKNGYFANKVGTYEKAVLAKENNIPFYVAAPMSSFDFSIKEIPIEERSGEEVLYIGGRRIFAKGARAKNPAFDITPLEYVTAVITETGVFKPAEL